MPQFPSSRPSLRGLLNDSIRGVSFYPADSKCDCQRPKAARERRAALSLLNAGPVRLLVFERQSTDYALATVLIKMSPWTEAEVAAVEDLFAICDHLDPVHPNAKVIDPLNPKTSFLSPAFFSGDLPENLQKRMEYRVSPCTDDRPYFNSFQVGFHPIKPDPERFTDPSMAFMITENGELIDFAPSALSLLCRPVPAQMQSRFCFNKIVSIANPAYGMPTRIEAYANERYSWNKVAKITKQVYATLLQSRPGALP